MNKTNFTPGPWHTPREVFNPMKHGHNPETYRAIGIGNGACHVGFASVSGCVGAIEADANANLIAAAPELFAALQDVLRYCVTVDGFPDKKRRTVEQQAAFDNARAALAKAGGGL